MSQTLINAYLSELDRIKRVSGSLSEQVISEAFKDLLKAWSRQQGLVFLAEQGLTSNQKTAIRPDGTILHDLRDRIDTAYADNPDFRVTADTFLAQARESAAAAAWAVAGLTGEKSPYMTSIDVFAPVAPQMGPTSSHPTAQEFAREPLQPFRLGMHHDDIRV